MIIPVMTRKGFSSGNPGDVFICLGLQWLMEKELGPLEWFYFDKFSKKDFEDNKEVLRSAGFLIYAGTPQYNNYDDWQLWYDWGVWLDYLIPMGIDFISIAGGSGFPNPHMTPKEFSDYCLDSRKTRSILNSRGIRTKLNTVRDPHARQLLVDFGTDTVMLPCTATWAARYFNIENGPDTYTALVPPSPLSVRPQDLQVSTREEVREYIVDKYLALYKDMEKKGQNPVIVCHSKSEYNLFDGLGVETFYTNDTAALLRFYSTCFSVVSSRLHGCLPALGLGIKNIVSVPIDTRGSAATLLGIPEVKLTDMTTKRINSALKSTVSVDLFEFEQQYAALFKTYFKGK